MGARQTNRLSRSAAATVLDSRVAGGGEGAAAPTLEVRWIRPGALATSKLDWFRPFVQEIESREDIYLVAGRTKGVSIKIRGGDVLDLKVAGEPGAILDVPGRSRGRLQTWTKWSFPIPAAGERDGAWEEWVPVGKHRRIGHFRIAGGEATLLGAPAGDGETTCAVELTEVTRGGSPWWTLGFEAAGPSATLREAIEATAALVFGDTPSGTPALNVVDSMSYSDWLRPSDPSLAI